MTDTPWDRHRFDTFLRAPQNLEGLVAAIDALPPADREAASTALDRELPALRHRLEHETHRDQATDVDPWHRGIVLVTLLDSTPSQVASMVTAWWVWKLWENEEVFGRVREALLARDRSWVQQLVDAILDRPDVGIHTRLAHPLVVTHNLPLPTQPEYWQLWAHELAIPRSEQRWEEHFLAACAVPDVLAGTANGQADYASPALPRSCENWNPRTTRPWHGPCSRCSHVATDPARNGWHCCGWRPSTWKSRSRRRVLPCWRLSRTPTTPS